MSSQRPTFRTARDIRDWLVEHHRAAMRSYDGVLAGPLPTRGRLLAQACRALESETARKFEVLNASHLERSPYLQYASGDALETDDDDGEGARPSTTSIDEKPLRMLAQLAERRRERPKGDVFESLYSLERQYVQRKCLILTQEWDM